MGRRAGPPHAALRQRDGQDGRRSPARDDPEGRRERRDPALRPLRPLRRVVLKLSGESLAGDGGYGIDPDSLDSTAKGVLEAVEAGAELAVVVGGGNIFRGSHVADELGIEGATADYMAMLGTVINAMALQAALEGRGVPTRV